MKSLSLHRFTMEKKEDITAHKKRLSTTRSSFEISESPGEYNKKSRTSWTMGTTGIDCD